MIYISHRGNINKKNVEFENNPKYIKRIMDTLNGHTIWDIYKLTRTNVYKHFIKNHKTYKKCKFNQVKFVKKYVNNNEVNFDKKLSIENASKYFVINYVNLKLVRYETSTRYRVLHYTHKRIVEMFKSLPWNLPKFFITF